MTKKRCAIYTRKSTEEGLDQEFNSLDAKREACEAYIKSQAHEGWKLVSKNYDDDGFSGGNLKRPALETLLDEVCTGKVDVIVVYKIDRLTRSLMDFSKIMDVFDASKASFAAVTQQFNTTTSMGRLTLNVLLSFAQFEREITGERIRDKIAASKKKGLWTGGPPPLGYDIIDKKLVVNSEEADRVRLLFERYLALGNVTDLVEEFRKKGLRNKEWTNKKGNRSGGTPFQRAAVHMMLQNRVYLGKVHFKGRIYEGEHERIVPQKLWDAVQENLTSNRKVHSEAKLKRKSKLLEGLLFDSEGQPLSPTYSVKQGNRRYPYYVSAPFIGYRKGSTNEVTRIPAQVIENLVRDRIATVMAIETLDVDQAMVTKIVAKVTVHTDLVEFEINHGESGLDLQRAEARGDEVIVQATHALLRVRATLRRRDKKMAFITPTGYEVTPAGKPDPILVKNVVTAWKWREILDCGSESLVHV